MINCKAQAEHLDQTTSKRIFFSLGVFHLAVSQQDTNRCTYYYLDLIKPSIRCFLNHSCIAFKDCLTRPVLKQLTT